jgi:hypothetical protein
MYIYIYYITETSIASPLHGSSASFSALESHHVSLMKEGEVIELTDIQDDTSAFYHTTVYIYIYNIISLY